MRTGKYGDVRYERSPGRIEDIDDQPKMTILTHLICGLTGFAGTLCTISTSCFIITQISSIPS
jgi:hypothetical protein